jgi:hypothetical protein
LPALSGVSFFSNIKHRGWTRTDDPELEHPGFFLKVEQLSASCLGLGPYRRPRGSNFREEAQGRAMTSFFS